jgi:hypothetical protein
MPRCLLCVQVLGDALRIKGTPSTQLYQAFEEAGTDLAQVGQTLAESHPAPSRAPY